MEKVIDCFAKFAICTAAFIGAPLVLVSGVFFTMDQFNRYVEVSNCKDFARLDQVVRKCE